MDTLDGKIIDLLRKNARERFVKIAKQLGVSEGTVRARVRALSEKKIIVRFTVDCKPDVEGLVFIRAKGTQLRSILDDLEGHADSCYEVTGEYDIVARLSVASLDELNKKVDRIRAIKGVAATATAIKLNES